MKAGALSERVAILRKTTAQDAVGQPITTWSTLATIWAEANEMRAREFFEAAGRQVEVTTRFRMRYTDLAYEDRLQWDGHQYEPIQIIKIGRKHGLEILAKRLDGNEREA
jgi:SPP1 family predicted phage head-tail adaptor